VLFWGRPTTITPVATRRPDSHGRHGRHLHGKSEGDTLVIKIFGVNTGERHRRIVKVIVAV